QQQLVEIVKALWRGESVLILDEATSMLTPQGVEDLGRVIGRLRDAGIAVLFITHKLHEAVRFGDRVSVLRQGRKAGELPPETLAALAPQEAIDHIVDLMFGAAADGTTPERSRARREAAPGERVVIEVDGLRPTGSPAAAGDAGVSFAVREGEIFGIAGVDGNGQKQLAEAIAGQRHAEDGRIVLDGTSIEGLSVRQRQHAGLRYVTDDRLGEGTVSAFPVGLNLLLKRIGDEPFWRHGIVRNAEVERHARALIAEHDVRVPGPETPLGHLSGGNVQKALLARELDDQPMAVIYNKPTYGLDLNNIRRARRAICENADAGVATILISTDLDEILELSDRIGVMLDGRLVGIVENDGDAARRVGELMIGVEAQA
ncbi:MAG: ATP-binding cassette domain-containing protein, partial [Rhodospirillaceae bacterium]|nr:ATP-binding cassette domain-containing protein [Rhodospirillaceae bacterium]